MQKIKAIKLTPGTTTPKVVEIGSDLRSLQAEVGGYIELVSLGRRIDAYVNEEGVLRGQPYCCHLPATHGATPVVGEVIVVSHDDEGETAGLTDAQIAEYLPKLQSALKNAELLRAAAQMRVMPAAQA